MRRASRYITFLLGLAVASAVLLAARPARGQQQARFEVIIVKATNDGNSMDQALNKYAHLLRGTGYTNFKKLRTASFSLTKGASKSITIASRLSAEFTYKSEINQRVAFKYRIFKRGRPQPAIHYSIPKGGKTVLVVPMGKIGYMLIIQVR